MFTADYVMEVLEKQPFIYERIKYGQVEVSIHHYQTEGLSDLLECLPGASITYKGEAEEYFIYIVSNLS